mgnify:CR=1 FL=1
MPLLACLALLCRWQDDYPDTWEPEEHVSPDLIALFERQRGLFDASSESDINGGSGSPSLTEQAAAGAAAGGEAAKAPVTA